MHPVIHAFVFALVLAPSLAGATVIDLATDSVDIAVHGDVQFLGCHHCGRATGDVNGDGIPDLLVSNGSAFRVLYGPLAVPSAIDFTRDAPDAVLAWDRYGVHPGPAAAFSLAVGDLDGDGVPDAALGQPVNDGTVLVLFGPICPSASVQVIDYAPHLFLGGLSPDYGFGFVLSIADMDGDGLQDLVVGAPFGPEAPAPRASAGAVDIAYGPLPRVPQRDLGALPHATLRGAAAGDDLGHSLVVADLNGDGVPDLAAGARTEDGLGTTRPDAGAVHVVFGPILPGDVIDLASSSAPLTIRGAFREDETGYVLAAGDLTGDGAADLVLTAPGADGPARARPNAGAAHVLAGPLAPRAPRDLLGEPGEIVVLGSRAGGELGRAVVVADVAGDCAPDLVLGAIADAGPAGRYGAGSVQVVTGPLAPGTFRDLAAEPAFLELLGAAEGDELGHFVAAGDLSGDGRADLIAGATYADSPTTGNPDAGEIVSMVAPADSGCGVAARPSRCFPRGAGFWHRQCLAVAPLARDPRGRALGQARGRGHADGHAQELTPDFHPAYGPVEWRRLQRLADPLVTEADPDGGGACEALEALPDSDPCERARRELATLVLNMVAGLLPADANLAGPHEAPVVPEEARGRLVVLIRAGECDEALALAHQWNEAPACAGIRHAEDGGANGNGAGGSSSGAGACGTRR